MSSSSLTTLVNAWRAFIASKRGTHAVTLCYNSRYGGTASTCYRIERVEAVMVPRRIKKGISIALPCPTDIRLGHKAKSGETHQLPTIRYIPLEAVQADVRYLHSRVDRILYGSRYNTRPTERRTGYLGFVENRDSNIHAHLAWRVPADRTNEFNSIVPHLWSEISYFGSVKIEQVRDGGWSTYMTKAKYDIALGDPNLFLASPI